MSAKARLEEIVRTYAYEGSYEFYYGLGRVELDFGPVILKFYLNESSVAISEFVSVKQKNKLFGGTKEVHDFHYFNQSYKWDVKSDFADIFAEIMKVTNTAKQQDRDKLDEKVMAVLEELLKTAKKK